MEMKIDARGMQCPLPVIEAKKAINTMTESGTITVTVDNEIAAQNVLKLAKQQKMDAKYSRVEHEEYVVILTIGETTKQSPEKMVFKDKSAEENTFKDKKPEEISIMDKRQLDNSKKKVVIISSNTMGSGDETLGKTLMKGFIFALTKQDSLPDILIFYNSGVFLTAEGSESLDDLKSLETEGVEIMTCGACLDFYQLVDKRKVGTVTNMYVITEIMLNAGLIIRP